MSSVEYGWLILCLLLVTTLMLGLWSTLSALAREKADHAFCGEFLEIFRRFGHQGGNDTEAYTWMMLKLHKMQNILGDYGVYDYFQPPFKNYVMQNYPIILNGIPELYNVKEIGSMAAKYYRMVEDCILRYMGVLEERIPALNRDVRNPISWLREGIRQFCFLPFRLFAFIGLMSESIGRRIYRSRIFSVFSVFGWILGLLSSVITILEYWEKAITLTKAFLAG